MLKTGNCVIYFCIILIFFLLLSFACHPNPTYNKARIIITEDGIILKLKHKTKFQVQHIYIGNDCLDYDELIIDILLPEDYESLLYFEINFNKYNNNISYININDLETNKEYCYNITTDYNIFLGKFIINNKNNNVEKIDINRYDEYEIKHYKGKW